MKKPEKAKTDSLGWIFAFLFPKKGKPAIPPKPAQPASTNVAPTNSTPPARQTDVVKPVTTPPQVIHSVSAPDQQPVSPRIATTPIQQPISPRIATSPARQPISPRSVTTPPTGQSQLTRLSSKPARTRKPFFELGKTLPAFWTVASSLSFIVNVILIVVLVVLARELFALKAIVGNKLLGGLYENFIYMDQAHIKTNITVVDNIPINFTLPISQDTVVTLTQNTPINGANVRITSGGLSINSAANIVLPAGTNLPVHLELNVPVNTTVPITLNVPVDIPLEQTELHKPFIGLQQVVAPFYGLLQPKIKTAANIDACNFLNGFCNWFFYNQ